MKQKPAAFERIFQQRGAESGHRGAISPSSLAARAGYRLPTNQLLVDYQLHSSRVEMRETLPLKASRLATSQSGMGAIWVSSRLRKASWRDHGLSFTMLFSPAFTS
jgi:hypothetical protein